MSTSFDPGKKAILVGLQRSSDLNGTHVTIERQLENGRISVVVPHPVYEQPKAVAIKPENLKLRDECPLCMDTEMDTEMTVGVNSSFYWCCGQRVCNQCHENLTRIDRCPICRADRSDYSEAMQVKWVRDRAKRGDTNAMCNLGGLYDFGRSGVNQDQALARVWYERAANKRHREAAHNLACSYRDGEGGPVDLKEALRRFKFAAELGYAKSMTNVGDAYLYGRGVAKDLDVAERWYKKAAATGQSERGMMKLEEIRMLKSGDIAAEALFLGGGRIFREITFRKP